MSTPSLSEAPLVPLPTAQLSKHWQIVGPYISGASRPHINSLPGPCHVKTFVKDRLAEADLSQTRASGLARAIHLLRDGGLRRCV
jgi:hypothetical protein